MNLFPGAVGITHLTVYDWPTPDGLAGGSPHMHLCSTELYMVIAGHGSVQTLSAEGFDEIELMPGKLVWFTPGVIHRLINTDGKLTLLIAMQNAGLPEAGDFVLTFPDHILADPNAYAAAASLSTGDRVFATDTDSARRRRDLAIEGFAQLREGGDAALKQFYARARAIASSKFPRWRDLVEAGPLAQAKQTLVQLDHLIAGDASHLREGKVNAMHASAENKLGMCGTLAVFLPEGMSE